MTGIGDGYFAFDDYFTNVQMILTIQRLAIALGKPLQEQYVDSVNKNNSIAAWAEQGVSAAYVSGILGETDMTSFRGDEFCSKEQSIIWLVRLYDYL